ncbi:MAG: glycosyltransferase [Bacteroidales bacterium]|nr:glycosyltransferase [Bacteroidales bacterium]
MKKAILSVTNDLVSDQRLNRTAITLSKCGYKVLLVGRKLPDSINYIGDFEFVRLNLLFKKGPLFYAEYNLRLFCLLFFRKADLFYANDLDSLPANFLASSFHGNLLIYDSHEYFTGVPELNNRKFVSSIWKNMEKFLLPRIKYKITVSNSVANQYYCDYKVNMQVIRNLPFKQLNFKKADLNLEGKKVVVYQGALNIHRGIEHVIKAFKYLENFVFIVVGNGDIEKELKDLSINEGVSDKIIFTGKIHFFELPEYTNLADVGISLEEDTNLNYRFALPNKLFDYIQAEVPVLVSELPEMASLVRKYGVGEVCVNRSPKEIASQIREIANNRERYLLKLKEAANELCWENESKKLIDLISSFSEQSKVQQ